MIDKVEKTDFYRLIEIWENAVIATHDFLLDEDFDFYCAQMPKYLKELVLYCYRDENDDIKGFLGVSTDKIEMLFVDDKYRGTGIGRRLVKFAIEVLRINKVDVNEQNTRAVEFYAKAGFKVYERSELDGEGKNYPILHLELQ